MQADDIYRFITLRQASSLPPADLHDPFLSAYTHQSLVDPDTFRGTVSWVLSKGDTSMARSLSSDRLQQLNVRSAWELIADTLYRNLFLRLPDLVRRGVIGDVEKAMMEAFDTSDFKTILSHISEIAGQRATVADYLTACSLTGAPQGDIDGAAHLVCCFETIERMLAIEETGQPASPRRAAWRIPLQHGVVTLPFDLHPAAAPAPSSLAAPPAPPLKFIGDLILLKQQLRRYELGEIAHIENVLAKEHLERTHRTLRRLETKLLTVEDKETEGIHDVQSTTRDELRSEIQKTVSEQVDLSVNFNVTATYMGPGMSVTGSVGGAAGYRRSSEERNATAAAHSLEVVSKASDRIRERTLTQRETVETQETEEAAKHGFSNDTNGHIVGIYRWLERAFDMHLVNYGRRLIYEFVVPEPGSYWTALVSARGDARSGPPPPFPQVALPPPATPSTRALALADFLPPEDADLPVRWTELVELAGQWGVTLQMPPPLTVQAHFALNAPGEATPDTTKTGSAVGDDALYELESGAISTVRSQEPMKIPEGYRATSGKATMQGWRFLRKSGTTYHGFEGGEAHLQLNGADYKFTAAGDRFQNGGLVKPPATIGRTFEAEIIPVAGQFIEGEVPVLLTTSLNGLTCSIELKCKRTQAHANAWSQKMFSLFAAAHADRLARYEDDRNQAQIGNGDWADNLPSKTARDIERRELKRGILNAITSNQLAAMGNAVLVESTDAGEPKPKAPALQLGATADYDKFVRFFELAFDWSNLSYIFAPYFYGRRAEWTRLAVADSADAQFKQFLSAGAARVQVPIRRGYEQHVEYFFAGLPWVSLEQRVPWLTSMRPIAEDLAAEAREGFEVGKGKISVAANSETVSGVDTIFSPEDVDREIRVAGKIYIVKEVRSATDLTISPAYHGPPLTRVGFELGGIVVGPTFQVKLPTTLVVIDKPALVLPEFPPRYAE